MKISPLFLGGLALAMTVATVGATTYTGNGNGGFGGAIGNGNLVITSSGSNVTFTLNNAGSFSGNDLVVYIDSVAGGFNDTSEFDDNQDGGREAISGDNDTNGSRSLVTFPTGFNADYAIGFENDTYDGLFGLVAGTNLTYITGATPTTTGGPYTLTIPLSDLGLTTGGTFKFVGTLVSTTSYRSNEAIGASDAPGGTTNLGYTGEITFTGSDTFVAVAAPEPGTFALMGVGALGLLAANRFRSRRP